jgi:hypothetical protein
MIFGPGIKPDFGPFINGPLFSKHGRQIILALGQNRVYITTLLEGAAAALTACWNVGSTKQN